MASFLSIIKRPRVWVPLGIGVLVVGGIVYSQTTAPVPDYTSTTVERMDLVQSVEETGTVRSMTDLSYGWEVSGRVAEIFSEVGDTVSSSAIIARLENSQERSRLAEGQSQLAASQAQLNVKLVGASEAQIASSLASVSSAEASLNQAKARQETVKITGENAIASAERAVSQAQTALERSIVEDDQDILEAYQDAIETAKSEVSDGLDVLLTIADLQQDFPELVEGFPYGINVTIKKAEAVRLLLGAETNGQRKTSYLITLRGAIRGKVDALTLADAAPYVNQDIDVILAELETALRAVREAADAAQIALNQSDDATATDLTTIESAVSTANSSVQSIVNVQQAVNAELLARITNEDANTRAIEIAQQTLVNARRNAIQDSAAAATDVTVAEANLKQVQAAHAELIAPPRAVDVAALRADVARQVANLEYLQQELEKTQLRALANGVVSRLDVSVGETAAAQDPVLGIVSSDLEIDVDISETDVAKVMVGNQVEITLDAFGSDRIFTGTVIQVDPAETEISGVVYYKTTIHLDVATDEQQGVRPGMTANVRIITATRPEVLVLPRRAVLRRDGRRIVRVLTDPATATYEEVPVQVGIDGEDGLIEIISGVQAGQEVITFIEE